MEDEKIIELTRKQMEKASGGYGTDCFLCPGTLVNDETKTLICSSPLKHVFGRKYRCVNGNCDLCGKDQYPSVK